MYTNETFRKTLWAFLKHSSKYMLIAVVYRSINHKPYDIIYNHEVTSLRQGLHQCYRSVNTSIPVAWPQPVGCWPTNCQNVWTSSFTLDPPRLLETKSSPLFPLQKIVWLRYWSIPSISTNACLPGLLSLKVVVLSPTLRVSERPGIGYVETLFLMWRSVVWCSLLVYDVVLETCSPQLNMIEKHFHFIFRAVFSMLYRNPESPSYRAYSLCVR